MAMQRKSTKPWIILIAAPIIALILTALMQVIVSFTLSDSDEYASTTIPTVVNIFSLVVGVLAVIGMFGLPAWIVMLIVTINHNNKLKQTQSNRKRK